MVYLEQSATLSFDESRMPDAQILRGNVRFRHDSALMYCDSAYFFQNSNSLHAFGNVRLVQGDSLQGYGDVLYYDGNSKIAKFRGRVRLAHKGTVLTTDSLNYDRVRDIAYYFLGGKIKDSLNTLSSDWGQYTPYDKQALFKGNVKLLHPKFTLDSDTLFYNTGTYQALLVSPTRILYNKQTTILSSFGWYNTKTERSMLFKRSRIIHTDGKTLTGDTIYYDKHLGYGYVLGNMQSVDSTHSLTLYGDRGEVWDRENYGYATDSAMLIDWSDTTKYTYMHADTLYTAQKPYTTFRLVPVDSVLRDSVWVQPDPDTIWVDTSYVDVRAYNNVRVYRDDVQMICDSSHYNGRDSITTLSGDPICWNEEQQISADTILIYFKNKDVDRIQGKGNSIAIKKEDEQEFNQLAGHEIQAYLKDGDIHMVDVLGNAETIFYPREEDSTFVGVNKTQSSFIKVYFVDRKINRVVFTTATTGVMVPMSQATNEDRYLVPYFWAEHERPRQPSDIFLHPQRTPRPKAQSASVEADEEEKTDTKAKDKSKKRNTNK